MIPCCFHPTRIIVVDDEYDFLKSLEMGLSEATATYKFFKSPQKVLSFLTEKAQPQSFTNRYISHIDEEEWEHRRLDVNVKDLHHEIYNPRRFEQISTLVVDYHMPGMNGLELCKRIAQPHVRKILLTGTADERVAIQAFNEGIIHHYIPKQDPNLFNRLAQAINKAQKQYFLTLSNVFLTAIEHVGHLDHAVMDPSFIRFFEKLLSETPQMEYYLCETMGSFLFLDPEGRPSGIIVNRDEQIETWIHSASAESAPQTLIEDLKARRKIICYHDAENLSEPEGSQWPKYAKEARKIEGKATYYYALGEELFCVDPSLIASFKAFKTEQT